MYTSIGYFIYCICSNSKQLWVVCTNVNFMPTAIGIFIVGFSSILTGLNFVVTIHRMRAPGLTWFRLPLFVWSLYATSLIQILATPVLAITLMLVMAERTL